MESVEELLRHLELVSEIGFGLSWTTRRPLDIEFGIGLVADGWFEIGGRQGHLRLNLELDVVEFGIGCRGELLRHLEFAFEIDSMRLDQGGFKKDWTWYEKIVDQGGFR